MRALRRGDLGDPDVVVDVQNGLPFFTRLVTRTPVVVLVHHVHREQWPVVYPGLTGRVGWWIERRLAPWLYRRCQYVAVSRATRAELRELGSAGPRVAVVHNGTDPLVPVDDRARPRRPPSPSWAGWCRTSRSSTPSTRSLALREELPGAAAARRRQRLVGGRAARRTRAAHGAGDTRRLRGARRRGSASTRSTSGPGCCCCPRLKEGWGLVVGEAGMHAHPDRRLPLRRRHPRVDRRRALRDCWSTTRRSSPPRCARLLADDALRAELGAGAREMSHRVHLGARPAVVRPGALAEPRGTAGRRARTPTSRRRRGPASTGWRRR